MDLRFIFKAASGKPRVLSKPLPVLVGRSESDEVGLRISKDVVSRRHCELFVDDAGRICLRDLGSSNGTFLDGRRLEPQVAVPISSGCTVRLGNVKFVTEYAEQPLAEDAPPAAVVEPGDGSPAAPQPATEKLAPADGPSGAEEPAAGGDFGFLAAAGPDGGDEPAWPAAADEPAAGDENLDDFFKSLS